jgi:transposase
MKYFAGLDVSLEETSICIVDETGRIVKELRVASEPEALVAALRATDLALERVGLEACSLTAWLHEGLTQAGLPAICIETRQANATMKTMPNKTDRNDARALAQIMRTGWFRQVHVKSRQCRLWRSLLIARRTILNEMRSIENVARAILREAGIKLGTPSRADFAERARELAGGDSEVTPLVEPLLAILATMLREFARLTKRVLDLARKEKVCRQLMSVPGVGPITALAFRATIDRPDRFKHSKDVGAHLGLTPARYQSGETDIQGRISRCGDELARTALYEAAHSLLTRSRKWSGLRAWGMKIAKHRGMARARVAVAQTRRHPASYVGRRRRVPFWKSACRVGAHYCSLRRRAKGEKNTANSPARAIRIVPMGTIGKAISLSVQSLPAQAGEVVKQIETPRLPDPIMRRPRANREEKRVTHGSETIKKRDSIRTGQLDSNDPNQRREDT